VGTAPEGTRCALHAVPLWNNRLFGSTAIGSRSPVREPGPSIEAIASGPITAEERGHSPCSQPRGDASAFEAKARGGAWGGPQYRWRAHSLRHAATPFVSTRQQNRMSRENGASLSLT
jgi:hypothetical protein